jgi:sarcosine oxidase/L-pipecolate oxidase
MSTGLFIIPPSNNILKVARHAYGYQNPTLIPHPTDPSLPSISVSLPLTGVDNPNQWVPFEGEASCRQALQEMIPSLGDRPFSNGRVCWYTDTTTGDFLICYHPDFEGLFLATGGSGHGYKFLPVIGDKIVDTVSGNCPEEFKEKWAWPKETVTEVSTQDGSRGGVPGLIFGTEMRRGR